MSLKKIESDILEHVYNMVLNIPDTVIVSIPSLGNPTVITHLKRMRQKIKNKIEIGEKRLVNEYSKSSAITSCNIFLNSESKSRISFLNGIDSQSKDKVLNSTKYGSVCTDAILKTTNYQNNVIDGSNTNNISNFQINTPLSLKTSYNDICTREHRSINELDVLVNEKNFDSFSACDVQSHSMNDFNYNKQTYLETKKSSFQSNYKV